MNHNLLGKTMTCSFGFMSVKLLSSNLLMLAVNGRILKDVNLGYSVGSGFPSAGCQFEAVSISECLRREAAWQPRRSRRFISYSESIHVWPKMRIGYFHGRLLLADKPTPSRGLINSVEFWSRVIVSGHPPGNDVRDGESFCGSSYMICEGCVLWTEHSMR
jgi:hypothetical protein